MEKRRPSYDLDAIKDATGSVETLAMTTSARRDAFRLGFEDEDIVETLLGINRRMFFKSMTTINDSKIWQDVYHVPTDGLMLYIKFQADVITAFTVTSFKEK